MLQYKSTKTNCHFMKEQNLKNHTRFVILYHFVGYTILLAVLIGSIVNVVNSSKENLYSATLILATNLVLGIALFFARFFALAANDRAIRSEENFRHFILTGSPMPSGLKLSQIVALRFAPDAEFPALTVRAKAEALSSSAIKKLIIDWKGDYERV
ncbi:MAG: hypothetical protein K2Q21_09980 [Chitinophagaceae bacterium]|nr:hypothetical protein [Chitinophagaceae bacterium]